MEIAYESRGSEARLADLLQKVRDAIRRHLLTLILVVLGVFALSVALIYMMPKYYQSTSRIRIDPTRNPLATNSSDAQASLAAEAIDTEVGALNSTELSQTVVRQLGLQRDPEFAKVLDTPAALSMSQEDRIIAVARAVSANLAVGRERLTYIIDVSFKSRDPMKSAKIANAFAQGYLDTKVGTKIGTAERQLAWSQRRLAELGVEVRDADERLALYRAKAGIVQGGANGTIADQQVAPLSNQLATAESDAASARSTLAAAQQQIARGGLESVSDVRSSPVVQDLRRQRAQLLQSIDEIKARYGDKHPEAIRVRDQLATIDAQINDEAARVVGSLRANATAADARAGSLRGSMGRLEAEQAVNTKASVVADSYARDAASKHTAYDKMAQMSLDIKQAAQNSMAQAEIVDRAQPPSRPSSPNKPLLLALALLGSLGAGAGTVLMREMLVSGMRTVEEIEGQFGIPILAVVPRIKEKDNPRPADILLDKPTSLFAEAFRNARASVLGVRGNAPPRVIAITSALPAEGKTTAAIAFARTLAMNGAKTLLLECDVRRARVQQVVDHSPDGPGLVEVLHGEASPREAITRGRPDGLDQLLVRQPYFSSENLFGNEVMPKLLDGLLKDYDLIVMDLPPLIGLADGRFLAALADATVLVVKWDDTPAPAVRSALGWLKSDGANTVGAIYTQVDTNAEAIGGLYYSKKYSSYYQAA